MSNRRASGFTLVEMIVAIVILGVGLAGVLAAFNMTVRSSSDPLIHKQMLAAAEEMMEEVLLKPFAITGAPPANVLSNCGTPGADRSAFDDVSDYNDYATTGICDIDGIAVAGLARYNLRVVVNAAASLGDNGSGGALSGGQVKQVTVTVTGGRETVTLNGWRTNYGS